MLIFGHELIPCQNFSWGEDEDAINCFFYDENLIKNNKNAFSILVKNKNEIFLSNAFGAKYLLFIDKNLAKFAAEAAEFYLFDSKILLIVNDFSELDEAYKIKVDGVILKNFIKNYPAQIKQISEI